MAGATNEAAGLAPEDISSAVLRHLLANASRAHLHVHAAVITVPATFGNAQRQATKAAAKKAGIAVRAGDPYTNLYTLCSNQAYSDVANPPGARRRHRVCRNL